MFRKVLTAVGLSLGLAAIAPTASAALIDTFEGNDCSGVFGQGFANCFIPADIAPPNGTPIIIKFDFDPNTPETIEINSALFPTIDGSEFNLGDNPGSSGTWVYTPGPGDPAINFFVAKGGNFFNLFSNDGDPLTDDWITPTNPNNNQPFGLSHLSFYDTDGNIPKVPEPATLVLLSLGLIGLAVIRRRKQ